MLRRFLAVAVLATAAACGDSTGPERDPRPNVSGSWSGTFDGGNLSVVLQHDTIGGGVTGTGSLTYPEVAVSLTFTGTYVAPNVSLQLAAQGYQPMNLAGQHAGGSITGMVNGSEYVNESVTLVKR